MIRPICKDILFLGQKAEPAASSDIQVAYDLLDTLKAHENECVGMAANMIGVKKAMIVVNMGMFNTVMINPVITKKAKPYDTEEGCLSLTGIRKCTRYDEIEVDYQDISFKKQHGRFSDWTAQIIQHEVDHLNGIII